MDSSSDHEKSGPRNPDERRALAALQRLQELPPPSSGVIGDDEYFRLPPLRFPDRPMLPPPKDMNDKAAVKKWQDHCTSLMMFGSGH